MTQTRILCSRSAGGRRCFGAGHVPRRCGAHRRVSGRGPRAFHGVKWKFATGGKVVSSAVWRDGARLLRQRRWQPLCRGRGDRAAALAVHDRRTRVRRRPRLMPAWSTSAATTASSMRVDAKSGALRWKFANGGERRFEAKGLHGMQPFTPDIPGPVRRLSLEPRRGRGRGLLRVRRWQRLRARCGLRRPALEVPHRRRGPRLSGVCGRHALLRQLGQPVLRGGGRHRQGEWRFQARQGRPDPQPDRLSISPAVVDGVVYTGCRDSNVYALDAATGKEKWRVFNQGAG